ncbi:ABC transporter permease [Hymenobacter sp. BT175]|uniref:ABC transporter permease n=1 Tax=Hymenobacter translucens TaxID=2886507 RepID=UPI001D0F2EE7|nr:ABC transporter permease [Hymenobacter translucens]MCC2547881.1 ABC transporter permease [Hymenobacter translucens]
MDKIWLIIQREYLTRVRKKSFIVMTLLTPLLMAGLVVGPVLLAKTGSKQRIVEIVDAGNLFGGVVPTSEKIDYQFVGTDVAAAKASFRKSKHTALLIIPPGFRLDQPGDVQLVSRENADLETTRRVKNAVDNQIEASRLRQSGIDRTTLDKAKSDLDLSSIKLDEAGGEQASNSGVTTGVAFGLAMLIYFFIFLYGVQIMRGVMEEKSNRIVEVIISSVKPFQLMMGKVLGIAAVGLTQLMLWILLSWGATTAVAAVTGAPGMAEQRMEQVTASSARTPEEAAKEKAKMSQAMEGGVLKAMGNLNLPLILGSFLFYFLGGYLLYGALFGAVGSAVDGETDSQQFMMPITIPLIATIIVAQSVIIRDPNGSVATWMSMIPLTSPIAMMMRIPFGGVPGWQLGLSMLLLVGGFLATIWIASRIYRVGILMHGKKVTYGELSKWFFYKA